MQNITKEEIQNIYDYSTSKMDIARKLLIKTNQNGVKIDEDILDYFSEIGIDSRDQISRKELSKHWLEIQKRDYELNPKYCLWCGKKLPFEKRFLKCCNRSCANSYSNKNKGLKSDETKIKISKSVSLARQNELKKSNQYKLLSELVKEQIILNENNYNINDKFININCLKIQNCSICNKLFYKRINKHGNLGNFSTCCDKCEHILKSQISKKNINKLIQEGHHKGWQSRNITSFPELFWIKVLDNNHIEYQREYLLSCKNRGNNKRYFLDFYIEINGKKIDLEIDGKLHELPDRIKSDQERDIIVKSFNIEIYRIKWNEINSDNGKLLMKEKIDKFLEYINKI